MNLKLNDSEEGRCVIFEGSMICKNSRAIERFILDMVRRDRHLKVDLSKVREVDRCGFVEIVATSPVVDVAMVHIPATRRKQQPVKSPPMPLTAYVSPVAAALSV
jgi:hypothetical protein